MKHLSWLLLPLVLIACGKLIPHEPYQDKAANTVRIATYNVNWGNGNWVMKYPDKTIALIARLKADVVLLQETTPMWQQQCAQLRRQYPYQSFKHYENAGGLAFLSKYPIHTVRYVTPNHGWHPFWIVKTRTPIGALTLVNVHLTPSLNKNNGIGLFGSESFTNASVREKEIKEISQAIPSWQKLIIAGDFNEGDGSRTLKFLKKQRMHDAIEAHTWPTWHWQAGPFLLQDRFDRVFYTHDLKAIKTQSLHGGSSDHFPVIVDFKPGRNPSRD